MPGQPRRTVSEWDRVGYRDGMAMTLRLNDEQGEALRKHADQENMSMQQVVKAAVDEYLLRHADDARTKDLGREEAARFANLLRRLGE